MKQYFNDPQQEVMYNGGQRFGDCGWSWYRKGLIHAAWNLRNMQRMPGSITGFVGANCKRVLTNTLPLHADTLGELGIWHVTCIGVSVASRRSHGVGGDFFEPDNWENILSFV